MSILKQISKTKKVKSNKYTPTSEGGLGLSPSIDSSSIDENIKKAKENELAKYWYDKYEGLVKEVSYQRKLDRQNLNELDEKLHEMNEGLLSEIATKTDSEALAPLDQKFVTFDKLAEHYNVIVGRLIPAGTGKMTTDYENIAFEKDREIIEKNQTENIEN